MKDIDRTSPILYQTLVTGETLEEVKLTWYGVNEDGREAPYFTKTLRDALIVGVSPSKSPGSYTEELTVAYGKIEWTFVKGGISASDSLAGDAESGR